MVRLAATAFSVAFVVVAHFVVPLPLAASGHWYSWLLTPLALGAVLMVPGYLASTGFWPDRGHPQIEDIALYFVVGVGVQTIPAVVALALHASFDVYVLLVVVTTAAVGVWAFFRARTVPSIPRGRFWPSPKWGAAFIAIAVVAVVITYRYPIPAPGESTYIGYAQSYVGSQSLASSEPFLGTGIAIFPRFAYDGWWPIVALVSRLAQLQVVDAFQVYLPPFLVLLALGSSLTLGSVLFRRREAGVLAAGMLLLVAVGDERREVQTNLFLMLFRGIGEDKFMATLILMPVAQALGIRYLCDGRRADLAAATLVAIALGSVHQVVFVLYVLSMAAFLGLRLLLQRQGTLLRRGAHLALLGAIALIIPAIAAVGTGDRGAGLLLNDGDLGSERQLQGYAHIAGVRFWEPAPEQPHLAAYPLEQAEKAFSDWRIWLHKEQILFTVYGQILGHPALFARPLILVALLIMPLLVIGVRRDMATQFILSSGAATLLLLFLPGVPSLLSLAMTPWMVWRISWLFPGPLLLVWLVLALYHLAGSRFTRAPLTRFAWVPLAALVAIALIPNGNRLVSRLDDPRATHPVSELLREANRSLDLRGKVIMADPGASWWVPAYVPGAYVVQYRWEVNSGLFPRERIDEALQRIKDVEAFFSERPPDLPLDICDATLMSLLERYSVDYVLDVIEGDTALSPSFTVGDYSLIDFRQAAAACDGATVAAGPSADPYLDPAER